MTKMQITIIQLKRARIQRVLNELENQQTQYAAAVELAEIKARQSEGFDLNY